MEAMWTRFQKKTKNLLNKDSHPGAAIPPTDDGRENWSVGTQCEIFYKLKQKWISGEIITIFTENKQEWLTIKHSPNAKVVEIQRFSKDIRPTQTKSISAMIQKLKNMPDKDFEAHLDEIETNEEKNVDLQEIEANEEKKIDSKNKIDETMQRHQYIDYEPKLKTYMNRIDYHSEDELQKHLCQEDKLYDSLESKIKADDIHFIQTQIIENKMLDINYRYSDIYYKKYSWSGNSSHPSEYELNGYYTALNMAVKEGKLNIVKLLVQSGAQQNLCKEKEIDLAERLNHLDIYQFLLMENIGGAMGTQLKETIDGMELMDGISIYYVKHASDTELKLMMDTLIKSIRDRAPFSDHILMICYEYLKSKNVQFTQSPLFKALIETYDDIIKDTSNKIDWCWLKNYFVTSSVWFKKHDISDQEMKTDENRLFNELLIRVRNEAQNQITTNLKTSLTNIRDEDKINWKKMTEFGTNIVMKKASARQPLNAQYSKQDLVFASSKASLDAVAHYNVQIYTNELILVASFIDAEFQNDIQFISKEIITKHGTLKQSVKYRKGPLKKVARCMAKVENDYHDMQFPSGAHLLDINRCTFQFTDISSQSLFLNEFIAYLNSNNNKTCIKSIVRIKNGWNVDGYKSAKLNNCQYTDIKLNILLVSKHNISIVAEVQFL
eukprot:494361_1